MIDTGVAPEAKTGESDELASAVSRLEAAMDRIAAASGKAASPRVDGMADRLDVMIAKVRSALDQS